MARAGFAHEPFADAPPELIGPVMGSLPSLEFEEADEVVIREVFARIDAQAALPGLLEVVERWQPDLVLRETAELGSLAAAERGGVPHAQVCIGMHEVLPRFAESIGEPLAELGHLAGLDEDRLGPAMDGETVLSLVPEVLDRASGTEQGGAGFLRFHEPTTVADAPHVPVWGDPEVPLVYVTFGSVTGSLPPFAGVFRAALDALADTEARVLMTVGRKVDPATLGALPPNARVEQWWPQDAALGEAAAMLGHGGFGTTMGALAAGVPQVVVPLFTFDQIVNGEHVQAVGAGLTVERGPASVEPAAAQVRRLLAELEFAVCARQVAAAMADLPRPADAVPVLTGLAG
ncbi:hypothetical protein C7S10_18610 [Nocardioides currus]|uniref:Erythromycin biosynthesis protein CIII-like C-terminal domain-containing protein n=1 Tax=Nocardioides currus TaxID=2133958 RepID=A0A2R7YSN7_9ACTN|nr:hypothetical protein C7S10_18610 [Nocardioides currus]